jgi:NAD-dependent DNA ligase
MKLDSLKSKYTKAKLAYYTASPILTDTEFDALEDQLRKLDPKWPELTKTGVKLGKKVEVALAAPMPSLNKVYPEDLPKWLAKNKTDTYVVMEKLDGSSVQLTYTAGKPTKLVTRGDGSKGKDISFLLPYLRLPTTKAAPKGTAVFRCEAVMEKRVFEKKWSDEFENSRNLVNGLLNRQDAHPALKDVHLVVLGRYGTPLLEGLSQATLAGLRTVEAVSVHPHKITASLLANMRKSSPYDMDGLVVAPSNFLLDYKNNDKPKNSVAFKVNDEVNAAEATVKRIIWQVTGRGRIVPKIEIEPTRIDGVTVKHAAAHNADWMLERKLGPGAVVKLLRSGGVIPKIVAVVKPGKFQPPSIPYAKDGCHFVVARASAATDKRIDVLNVVKFMKTLGVELIATSTAANLWDAGLATPTSYIVAFGNDTLKEPILSVYPGRQGEKIYDELTRVLGSTISLKKLIAASQVFGVGIGERKLEQIEASGQALKGIFTENKALPDFGVVPGFSTKTLLVLKKGYPEWAKFYKIAARYLTINGSLPKRKVSTGGKLAGLKISFTGYRDKAQEEWITANGGEIVPFGKSTTVLLYKDGGKASSKIDKAADKGVRVCVFQDL